MVTASWTADRIAASHPILYHMAQVDSWEAIKSLGLLSTSAVLDLLSITGDAISNIESKRRPNSVTLLDPTRGSFTFRDQKPLNETILKRCLVGMTPQEWYEQLNSLSFLWPTKNRLQKMLGAGAYKSHEHLVLRIDTAKFLKRYSGIAMLSPINSGATLFNAPKRGRDTFKKIPASDINAIAEIVVPHSIPDILEFTLSAHIQNVDAVVRDIWKHNDPQPN